MSQHKDIQTASENVIVVDSTTPTSLRPTSEEGLVFFQQQAAAAKGMRGADRSDAAVSDLPKLIIPNDSARGSEGEDTKLTSSELGRLMQPRDANSPFKGFQDLSAIAAGGDTVPIGRRAAGLYTNNEDAWLVEVDRRIRNGDIDQNTLVVGMTGHGPTIAHEMAKHFHSDIYQHYPDGASEPRFAEMKRDQFQTFAKATSDYLKQPRIGSSTFVDVDIHQEAPLTKEVVASLPDAEQLIRMGIKKVFVAEEKPPSPDGVKPYEMHNADADPGNELFYRQDKRIYDWLNALKRDGRIEIVTDGLDARDKSKMAHRQ